MHNPRVLVVATSRKTRGGITSVIKAYETGEQWKKFHCKWIETHRDGNFIRKIWYLFTAFLEYIMLLPFYNIIHIHVATTKSAKRKLLFLYPAKWMKKKIIIHFHPSNEKFLFEPQNKKIYRSLFLQANLVLVLSNQWRKWINEALDITENIEILYNPCAQVSRGKYGKKNYILFAGSIIARKGYADLIKGFSLIKSKYPDWTLVFAGNGEIEQAKKLAQQYEIEQQTQFLGWVTNEKKEKIFQESSIYCLTSYGEGFPMGVLDAWAYGIPCIVTPVGGIPDIIQDNQNGLIYPAGDIMALSKQLDKLISNPTLREYIVKQSDQYVSGEFNIKTICKKLELIYLSL